MMNLQIPMTSRNPDFESKKPFLDHLEDFRVVIFKVFFSILIAGGLCLFFSPQILKILKFPLSKALVWMHQEGADKNMLMSLSPAGGFTLSIKLALLSGLILALPFILYFLLKFISPALKENEKRYLFPIFAASLILFTSGTALCYFYALPQSLRFLWMFNERLGITTLWTIESYVSFASLFLLAFGLAFETPVLILGLVKLNILSPYLLRTGRRYAIVIIFIVAAVLTPPDAFSQILLAIPMLLLYEICVWLSTWIKQ